MRALKNITLLQWIGIIILFNTTLLGGASQLGDLSLSPKAVKAILAIATLGNGFLGGLVTMFGGPAAMAQAAAATPTGQDLIVRQVLAMPGVEHIGVNAQANPTLAQIAIDPHEQKIEPIPGAAARVQQTANTG